jgi:hypothetical protein
MTIAEISRRWRVDPATARDAIKRAGIPPCDLFISPRYGRDDVLQIIEAWPAAMLEQMDQDIQLETAESLANRFGVTPQTIRNYGRAGRFHRVEISSGAVRYGAPFFAKNESEGKTDDIH